jgi:hypothetical protein
MFEFVPGFHHSIVFILPSFSLPWLKAFRPVGDSVSNDSVEQLLVEISPARPITVSWANLSDAAADFTMERGGLEPGQRMQPGSVYRAWPVSQSRTNMAFGPQQRWSIIAPLSIYDRYTATQSAK